MESSNQTCQHTIIFQNGMQICSKCYEIIDSSQIDTCTFFDTHTMNDGGFVIDARYNRNKISAYGKTIKVFSKQNYNSKIIYTLRNSISQIVTDNQLPTELTACTIKYFEVLQEKKNNRRYDTAQIASACFYYACRELGLLVSGMSYRTIANMFNVTTHKLTRGLRILHHYVEPPAEPIIDIDKVITDALTVIPIHCASEFNSREFIHVVYNRVQECNLFKKYNAHRIIWIVVYYLSIALGTKRSVDPRTPYSRQIIMNSLRAMIPYNYFLLAPADEMSERVQTSEQVNNE